MSETEITIDVSKLKGKRVLLATPMYGGLGNAMFFSSVLRLQDLFNAYGIKMDHAFMANESLIDRARNGLVQQFLELSSADYLLFVDADIQFNPEDVVAMMSYEKEIICGPYPKKAINWPIIIEAVKHGIEDPATLAKLVGEYVFTPLGEEQEGGQIVRVSEAGTGLMLIHRSVFGKLKEAYPENYYVSDSSKDVLSGEKKEMHAYFRTAIVDNRYLSEDYYFCHTWRKTGGDVWLFPWSRTVHYGTYGFEGSVGHLIDILAKIRGEKK